MKHDNLNGIHADEHSRAKDKSKLPWQLMKYEIIEKTILLKFLVWETSANMWDFVTYAMQETYKILVILACINKTCKDYTIT